MSPASAPTGRPASATLEAKRQALYAAALVAAPEAGALRKRALERVVLASLLGTSPAHPFRIRDIQEAIAAAGKGPTIRADVIQTAVDHLRDKSHEVGETKLGPKRAYYLLPRAEERIQREGDASSQLLARVLDRVLRDSEPLLSRTVGERIFRRFLTEAFNRFGLQIAKTVTGRFSRDDLLRSADVRAALALAARGESLAREAQDFLEARAFAFLGSTELDEQRLKFVLTQGYYITQLLGIEFASFDPLAEQSFSGAVFYLDTNVILLRLLGADDGAAALCTELIAVSKRLNFTLRVTRATLDEVRRVVEKRGAELQLIVNKLPAELTRKANNELLDAFLSAREQHRELTVAEFIAPLDHAYELVTGMGIEVDERTERDLLADDDSSLTRVADVLNERSEAIRGFPKSPAVLSHDLAHYALTVVERKHHSKTWFLSRDQSVVAAAGEVGPDNSPFCFSLAGFLQSISPFVTANEETRFIDVFSHLLADQLMPPEQMYEIGELVVLAQLHDDVQITGQEKLEDAYAFVRSSILKGRPARRGDEEVVALGLRRFLASSADEQRRTLEAEADRLRLEQRRQSDLLAAEMASREAAEKASEEMRAEVDRVRLREEQTASALAAVSADLVALKVTALKRNMFVGFAAGALTWWFRDALTAGMVVRFGLATPVYAGGAISLLGCAAWVWPSMVFLRCSGYADWIRYAAAFIIVGAALTGSRVLSDAHLGYLGSLFDVTGVATGAAFALVKSSQRPQETNQTLPTNGG